ncbi:MAG: peptide chain release factor 1 [Candidatus Cloacimonadota bacterium]|nr:MAG: peptide chain release factor 1 [Candidatus Cloacimonadota bacterium]
MIEKLEEIKKRFDEITKLLESEEVMKDKEKLISLSKERSEFKDIVTAYSELRKLEKRRIEAQHIIKMDKDEELKEIARVEREEVEEEIKKKEKDIRNLLSPKDALDDKNIIVEIRAGAGGEEAALFVKDLFEMYTKFANSKTYKIDVLSSHPTGIGGFKEVIFMISGKGAFSKLKHESGVHRVQRVPITESGGRIHTSTATVAVLPEAEEVDIDIDPKELKIDVFHSSGPGGQNVNKLATAIRITHLPSGMVVTCQDERSQHKNREKAMKVLRSRFLDIKKQEEEKRIAEKRRNQVGTGDRSERIRTYNFSQNRVTDHRIGLSLYKLEAILNGDLNEIIEKLTLASKKVK